MVLSQSGTDFDDTSVVPRGAHVTAPSGFALGDPRLHLKFRFYGKDRGFQIAISHWLGFPLGDDSNFGGEKHFGGFSGEPRILAGWEGSRWRAGVAIGFLWRANVSNFFSTVAGQQLTYGGAFAFDVLLRRLSLVAELYGHSNSFDSVTISNAGSGKISITDVNDAPLELDIAASSSSSPACRSTSASATASSPALARRSRVSI